MQRIRRSGRTTERRTQGARVKIQIRTSTSELESPIRYNVRELYVGALRDHFAKLLECEMRRKIQESDHVKVRPSVNAHSSMMLPPSLPIHHSIRCFGEACYANPAHIYSPR